MLLPSETELGLQEDDEHAHSVEMVQSILWKSACQAETINLTTKSVSEPTSLTGCRRARALLFFYLNIVTGEECVLQSCFLTQINSINQCKRTE